MPIEASWIKEPTIRLHRYFGNVKSTDFEPLLSAELAFLNTCAEPVYYIADYSNGATFPINPMQMPVLMEFIRHRHFGAIAYFEVPSLVSFWVTVFNKVTSFRIIKANDLAHAQVLLEKMVELDQERKERTF